MEAKKLKVTVAVLEEIAMALSMLDNPKLTIPSSYWIGRSIRSIGEELKEVIKQKDKLLKQYAQFGDDGKPVPGDQPGTIKLITETRDKYWEELGTLMSMEVEIRIWPISSTFFILKDKSIMDVSPRVMGALLDFFDEADITTMEKWN
jgi:hypothetical protein